MGRLYSLPMRNPFRTESKVVPRQDIKQVFFSCKFKDPEGLYADEVDIYEFAEKLLAYATPIIAKAERDECVKFVSSLNHLVGEKLAEKRG
jgi:hypothetical protein